jgi:hypothetical protein
MAYGTIGIRVTGGYRTDVGQIMRLSMRDFHQATSLFGQIAQKDLARRRAYRRPARTDFL